MASRRFYQQNSSVGRNNRRGGGAWRLDIDNAPGESRAGLGFGKSSHHVEEPVVGGSVGVPLADELSSVEDSDTSSKPVSSYDEKVAEVDAKLASFLAEINSLPSVEPSPDGPAGTVDSAPVSSTTLTSPTEENPSYYGSVGEGKSAILFVKSKEVLVPTLQLATSTVESLVEDSSTDTTDHSNAEIMQEPTTVWQHCFDESTQYYYFWNTETNEVTWEIPDEYSNYLSKKKLYDEWYSHNQGTTSTEKAQHSLDSVSRTGQTENVDAKDTALVDSQAAPRHEAPTESGDVVTSLAISAPAHAGGATVRRTGLVMYAGSDSGSDEDDDGEEIGTCSVGRVSTSLSAAVPFLAVQPPPPPPPDHEPHDTATVASDAVSSDVVLPCSMGISTATASRGVLRSAKDGDAEVVGTISVAVAEMTSSDDDRSKPLFDSAAAMSVVYGPVEAPSDFHNVAPSAAAAVAAAVVVGDSVDRPLLVTGDADALHSTVDVPSMSSAAGELGSIVAALSEVSCHGDSADGALAAAPSTADLAVAPATGDEQLAAASDIVLVADSAGAVPERGDDLDTSVLADRASYHLAFKSYEDVENIAQPVGPDEPLVFRPLPPAEHAAEASVPRAGRASGRDETRRKKRVRTAAAAAEQIGPADGEELPSSGRDGEAVGSYVESAQSGKRQRLDRDRMDAGRLADGAAAAEAFAENRGLPEAELEAGESDLTTLSSTVLEKLAFFDVSYDRLSPLQLLLVQTKVRLDDWQSGGLDRGYLLRRLREADMTLRDYEQYAVPPGWSCHWDRYGLVGPVVVDLCPSGSWHFPVLGRMP